MKANILRRGAAVLLGALLLAASLGLMALAAGPIDTDRTGSISVYFGEDGAGFSGAEFKLYRVASVSEDCVFTLTGDFARYNVAVNDLNARLMGVSCAEMLGGPYRREVPLCWVSGGTWFEEEKILRETKQKIDEGYKAFKIKAGHFEQDIRLAQKLRSICPPDVQLNIDPNQRYSREELVKVSNELRGVVNSIEEPVPVWDDEARVEFTRRCPEIALLSDESTFTVPDTARQMRLGAVRRLGVKIPRTGFTLTRKQVYMAESADIPAQVSTQGEMDLGCAACLQFAAAFKQVSLPCEIAYFAKGMYPDSMLLGGGLRIEDGRMLLPDGPGMGVEVNWDIVEKYDVKL